MKTGSNIGTCRAGSRLGPLLLRGLLLSRRENLLLWSPNLLLSPTFRQNFACGAYKLSKWCPRRTKTVKILPAALKKTNYFFKFMNSRIFWRSRQNLLLRDFEILATLLLQYVQQRETVVCRSASKLTAY